MTTAIPWQCQAHADNVSAISAQIDALQEELAGAGPQRKQQLVRLIEERMTALEQAQATLDACIASHPQDPERPAPPTDTVAMVSADATPVPRKQSIRWSFLQRKLDRFVNQRSAPPLFTVRLHHLDDVSTATVSMIEAFADAGQVKLGYRQVLQQSLGALPKGYRFNDVNSQSISLTADPAQRDAPLALKIVFETGGDIEFPTSDGLLKDMDFLAFDVTIRFSFAWRRQQQDLDFLAWIDAMAGLDDDQRSSALERFVHVNIVTSSALDPGGMTQKAMRLTLFGKLAEARQGLNRKLSSWLLGGDGSWPVTDFSDDGITVELKYEVPRHEQDPFPDMAPPGWPFTTATAPAPALDFSLPPALAAIDHIVVLTMENRSFDHMLGYLSLPVEAGGRGLVAVDGLRGGESVAYNGQPYPSYPLAAGDTVFGPDPGHSFGPVFHQINADPGRPGSGRMDGFVRSFVEDAHARNEGSIMGYHTGDNVPTYDALVRDFAFSHRWFASHPGPTFCNRFYETTGRLNLASGLDASQPKNTWELSNSATLSPALTRTIFDHLGDAKVSWKYYEDGYCFLRFFAQHTFDDDCVVDVDDPQRGFFADAARGNLPSVAFIDPHYIELPPDANCDGPVADVKAGQALVRRVVEAIVASPQYERTLLVVTYDEHGGFYDHVPPPPALPFANEVSGGTYGVRVPAFFVSPRVAAGQVWGHDGNGTAAALHFDHTSILKTIARRFMAGRAPYLGPRYAAAADLSAVLATQLRRSQFLPFVGYGLRCEATNLQLAMQPVMAPLGAGVQQAAPDGGPAQEFSFEDAGGGLLRIRSRIGNLYLTADASRQVTLQRLRAQGLEQLWSLKPGTAAGADPARVTVSNAAYPAQVLQPAGSAAVVLADPAPGTGPAVPNAWRVALLRQAAAAPGPAVAAALASYSASDAIAVSWSGLPGNAKDWVGIAPEGAPATTVAAWAYAAGAVAGQASFNAANLAPGRYVARAFVDDSYRLLAESPAFAVLGAAQAAVTTDHASYTMGQPIVVRWSGLAAGAASWVGYAPVGSPDATVTRWVSAGGLAAGSASFEAPPGAGTYVARAFATGSYAKAGESAAFVVQ